MTYWSCATATLAHTAKQVFSKTKRGRHGEHCQERLLGRKEEGPTSCWIGELHCFDFAYLAYAMCCESWRVLTLTSCKRKSSQNLLEVHVNNNKLVLCVSIMYIYTHTHTMVYFISWSVIRVSTLTPLLMNVNWGTWQRLTETLLWVFTELLHWVNLSSLHKKRLAWRD